MWGGGFFTEKGVIAKKGAIAKKESIVKKEAIAKKGGIAKKGPMDKNICFHSETVLLFHMAREVDKKCYKSRVKL